MRLPDTNFRPWQRRAGIVLAVLVVLTLAAWIGVQVWRPPAPTGPVARIRALVDAGHTAAAIPAIETFGRAHPDRKADVFFLEGYTAAGQGHWTRAARLYGEALNADPKAYRRNATIRRQLLAHLTDDDCLTRTSVAQTLAKLGDPSVVGALEAALAREAKRPQVPHDAELCTFTEAAKQALKHLRQAPHRR